jgi:hypothetical protein
MPEAAEYRLYAQKCFENAATAPSERDRKAWHSLAQYCLQLATEAEGRLPTTPDTKLGPIGRGGE